MKILDRYIAVAVVTGTLVALLVLVGLVLVLGGSGDEPVEEEASVAIDEPALDTAALNPDGQTVESSAASVTDEEPAAKPEATAAAPASATPRSFQPPPSR